MGTNMDDLRIRSFKNQIIDILNKEPICLEIKRLVLSDILAETKLAADADIKAQIALIQEEKARKESEKSEPENSPE